MPATAQVNVKLDQKVKTNGDTALAEVGLTSSEAVRRLWIGVSKRGETRASLLRELERASRTDEESAAINEKIRAIETGATIVEDAMAKLGLSVSSLRPLTDEEVDALKYEHLMSKGMV